ncbi:MAG: TRAP transporter large permease subunit [Dehalococcoidales bacterium]|jgi:tripartite ATP-independent transporter DctM subunit
MSVELFTVLMFGSFFLLLALGLPLAWATLSLAVVFGFILQGSSIFQYFAFRTWDMMNSFSMIAIPLFVFMANMLQYSGIADDLFNALYRWLGPLRGGLAIATVLVCTVLAAMVGTTGAGVTIMGLIALPAMFQRKYNKSIALGCICAGGALGTMIPPSIMFIVYGANSGTSIGKLFMGGVGPGLVLAALYIVYIGLRSYLNPTLAPPLPKEERAMPLLWKIGLLRTLILPVLLILAVLGAIYFGVATPGEAAGLGAAGAMICAAVRGKLNWRNLKLSVYGTLKTVGLIMWIVFGAYAFIGVYTLAGGAKFIGGLLSGLPLGNWGILIVIQLILILLGMVLDVIGIIILCVPIFIPIIATMGFDLLWFGIIFNINLQVAYLSPPFGYAMFYLKAVAPEDVTTVDLYRAVWPFMILQVIGLAIVMAFPPIATWLPNRMIR